MAATVLFAEEMEALIEYARQRFEVELYPYVPELERVRRALDKLEPKPKLKALPPSPPSAKLRGGRRRR